MLRGMKYSAISLLVASSMCLSSLAHAQFEVPDFRGFEQTVLLEWDGWTDPVFFAGQLAAMRPDASSHPAAYGQIANPSGYIAMPTPGQVCSTSERLEVGYGHQAGDVEEVVIQVEGPSAASISAYLLYPDFPDPEALGHIEARDLPGGGKLFRFLASPMGGGLGTYSEFMGFAIYLSIPNGSGPLCVDAVQLDVRHALSGSFDTVCGGATLNSLTVQAGMDLGGSSVASDNLLELTASGLPSASVGLFLASRGVGSTTCSGTCLGALCLDPSDVGRIGPALNAGADHSFERTLDLTNIPTNPSMPAMAGQSWYFQAWYRDTAAGQPVSRFTDSVAILFM